MGNCLFPDRRPSRAEPQVNHAVRGPVSTAPKIAHQVMGEGDQQVNPAVERASSESANCGPVFTFREIRAATDNFHESRVIGKGGYGKVYKGVLKDGTEVAVKRNIPGSRQGDAEFRTEVETLSLLRHRNLVSLIGYCNEGSELILVYDYMANGTLEKHLHESGSNHEPLTWSERLEICTGAASGLHYLHTGALQSIIHRDVKTTNILLDGSFDAKVADFGISKTLPDFDQTHVTTLVKGTRGYLDPEYHQTKRLTKKSDVYSFGVVLLEVLCARHAFFSEVRGEWITLAAWVKRQNISDANMLTKIVDPTLRGRIGPESLEKYWQIAMECLAEEGRHRPTMERVLEELRDVLKHVKTNPLAADQDHYNSSNGTN